VKTTLEIPDSLFRRAKAKAAESGIPLRQFVTDAVAEKLRSRSCPTKKPWLALVGELRHLHKETARIDAVIAKEFETIDPEEWS